MAGGGYFHVARYTFYKRTYMLVIADQLRSEKESDRQLLKKGTATLSGISRRLFLITDSGDHFERSVRDT